MPGSPSSLFSSEGWEAKNLVQAGSERPPHRRCLQIIIRSWRTIDPWNRSQPVQAETRAIRGRLNVSKPKNTGRRAHNPFGIRILRVNPSRMRNLEGSQICILLKQRNLRPEYPGGRVLILRVRTGRILSRLDPANPLVASAPVSAAIPAPAIATVPAGIAAAVSR
jgi:hypothetical protein